MKRYNHLFGKITAMDNLALAHRNARKGKAHYREVRDIDANPAPYLAEIQHLLLSGRFSTAPYTVFDRVERGKLRTISRLPYFPDRIVHHAICQICAPIWYRQLIRDTYSAIPGRGVHDGMRRLQGFLRDRPATRYCLKMDVRHYYPSVDNARVKTIIRRKIQCRPTLALIDEIIDSAPGLPLGNYLSQWLANLYLSGYDHWAKETRRMRYYSRYCDDLVFLSSSKGVLHQLRRDTSDYLATELGLQVKGNWQVFSVASRGIDYLGYRFFHNRTLVRRAIATSYKRAISRHQEKSIASYRGWLIHADCRHLLNTGDQLS